MPRILMNALGSVRHGGAHYGRNMQFYVDDEAKAARLERDGEAVRVAGEARQARTEASPAAARAKPGPKPRAKMAPGHSNKMAADPANKKTGDAGPATGE